jgi:hypothetical protein
MMSVPIKDAGNRTKNAKISNYEKTLESDLAIGFSYGIWNLGSVCDFGLQ